MLNLILWILIFAGLLALIGFAWRSAMRQRGFKLLELLAGEEILRHAVDVPVRIERGAADNLGSRLRLARRGTLVLTRKRLAGFAHRVRFVLVKGTRVEPGAVRAEGEWLLVRPVGKGKTVVPGPTFRFRVPDAEGWEREAIRVLRGR